MSEQCGDPGGLDFHCELPPHGDERKHRSMSAGLEWENLQEGEIRDLVADALPDLQGEELAQALSYLAEDRDDCSHVDDFGSTFALGTCTLCGARRPEAEPRGRWSRIKKVFRR